jgi:hypothetical protein
MTRSTLPPEVSAPQGTGCEPNKVSTRETDKEESKFELKSNSDQDRVKEEPIEEHFYHGKGGSHHKASRRVLRAEGQSKRHDLLSVP